jgi:hypothetical protein
MMKHSTEAGANSFKILIHNDVENLIALCYICHFWFVVLAVLVTHDCQHIKQLKAQLES